MTLEPDGQAAGCNPVEVGSIPTGVSFKQGPLMLFVQRRIDPIPSSVSVVVGDVRSAYGL